MVQLTRKQVIQRADRIRTELKRTLDQVEYLLANLRDGTDGREVRDYDMPTADPAEIEAKHGIVEDHSGVVPDWYRERFGGRMSEGSGE